MEGSNAICGLRSAIRGAKESFESTFFELEVAPSTIVIVKTCIDDDKIKAFS